MAVLHYDLLLTALLLMSKKRFFVTSILAKIKSSFALVSDLRIPSYLETDCHAQCSVRVNAAKEYVDPLEPKLFGLLLCTSRSASVCTCVCVCVHVFTCHSFSSSAIKASRVLLEAEKYLLMTISANLPKLSCFLKASRLLVIHVSRQRSIIMTYNCI